MLETYMAGWDSKPADRLIFTRKSQAAHQRVYEDMKARGYRPLIVAGTEGLLFVQSPTFCSIWEKNDGRGWTTQHAIADADYQAKFNQLKADGWRPVSVTASGSASTRFCSVWERNDGRGWSAAHGVRANDYQREFDQNAGRGLRPISVCPYKSGRNLLYATVWDNSPCEDWRARHNLSLIEFDGAADQYAAEGFIMISGGVARVDGRDWYAGIWEKRSGLRGAVRQAFDHESLMEYNEEMKGNGRTMRTIAVTSLSGENDALLDFTMQQQPKSLWCWATSASMISNYYGIPMTPCQLVNLDFGTNRCCGNDPFTDTVNCNNGGDLGRVLGKIAMHKSSTSTKATFNNLAGELRAGRPVGMHLTWKGGGEHYFVITGCQIGNLVRLADPGSGTSSWVPHAQMLSNSSYDWTGTTYTKRPV